MISVSPWIILLVVSLVGGIGALVRYAATVIGAPQPGLVRRRITAINIVGASLAGMFAAIDDPLAVILSVGLFGSLTTLSTIAVWWADDIRQRQPVAAVRSVLAHVLVGIPAVGVGFLIGQMMV